MGVHAALARAKRFKCVFCGGGNPSLACMYMNTACCRPMHFRCSLIGGASLIAGFKTYCPRHANKNEELGGEMLPPRIELYHERTPIDEKLIGRGSGCSLCEGDSYDTRLGAILTCSSCQMRMHTRCRWPEMETDAGFSALSWQGKFLCTACMKCVSCQMAIDKDVYNSSSDTATSPVEHEAFDGMQVDATESECDTVKCLGCGHFAIHITCLPPGCDPHAWRCDLCLTCKHCSIVDIPRGEWHEALEACSACAKEIKNGGVVCPICHKVYREGENIPMVQCDYCDEWLHALGCAGMTKDKFKKLQGSDAKYRCPICTTEKKKRDHNTKQAQNARRRYRVHGTNSKTGRGAVDLYPDAELLPVEREIVFQSIRKVSASAENFSQTLTSLSPDVEMCRLCGSGGREETLLFCTDCGECYHDFCHGSGAASPFSKSCGVKRNGVTGLAVKGRPWRCLQCESMNSVPCDPIEVMRDATCLASQALANGNAVGLDTSIPMTCNGNGHLDSSRERDGTPDDSSIEDDDVLDWADNRCCELCGEGERCRGMEGRLMPWASGTDCNESHCWVHIGCAIWSVGVSVKGTRTPFDYLLVPRRRLLRYAKQTSCEFCGKRGATLRCAADGCSECYHFRCAQEIGAGCVLRIARTEPAGAVVSRQRTLASMVNMVDIQELLLYCPSHRLADSSKLDTMFSLQEAQSTINLRRVLRIFDITDFSKNREAPKKKKALKPGRLLSIRLGSLSVLQFGRLVPEVNDFIVQGCLVPLGYCAARKFWSVLHPGKRCLYFFEVCGYPQTGPVFVIRCSDSISLKFQSRDPDAAWSMVTERVKQMRRRTIVGNPVVLSFQTTGLQAFGLAHCIPVVTHIESLPMASMFAGRYSLKRVATHRSNEIVFYNSLARKFVPVEIRKNITGCAKSEGYLPLRYANRVPSPSSVAIPTFKNARTGSAFQLSVAREVFSQHEYIAPGNPVTVRPKLHPTTTNLMSKSIDAADRSRANKSTPSLPYATQHRCIASTSRSRTVVLRSDIEGCGVFATKDIPAGEMVIEYVGEIIRPVLSDVREAKYLDRGIGCYMFEIETGVIVDATMRGNAARYINHSCAPNCFSKTITTENDQKVVVIFAKRTIQRGEELSYDYQFPFDDSDRVKCACGADQCKGWMN
ncbi:unnamed protein product [Chondrus crispus]|uniref:Histone-lysine N-methyltransferase n=1 Tax=Chondrus crispus TaxID=2769 RepID=R7QFN8_CHOCR|nr:unnamed protein product [Chondrus crispus]CDF36889.1 unnamed protein product [Chondrus crispus]|eukprot:XP_005716708.1 unnamed protein product [Chondrus crispus]